MSIADLTLKPRGLAITISLATLIMAIVAGLINSGIMPLDLGAKSATPGYWHQAMILFGLVMPLAILIWQRQQSLVRFIFSAYLILLFAHILMEIGLVVWLGSGIAAIVGVVYSMLRLVQLWAGYDLTIKSDSYPQWLTSVLLFLVGIWSINLARLLLKFVSI
jgi:hypothetical protein